MDDTLVPSRTRAQAVWGATRGAFSADARALVALAVLTTIVAWNLLAFDDWLTRSDMVTQYLPWFTFLGEQLRALDIPGWNPHLFSGAPFAGNPQSNWMYVPAMVTFPLLPTLWAFKAMVVVQLAVAGITTYAYGRVLGFGSMAALVAAITYVVGPLLYWTTYCCLIMGEFAVWIPLLLLGLELALRAHRWPDRVVPWGLTGCALSQMFAGWVGEGWIYAGLLIAAYIGYRVLLSPPRSETGLRARLAVGVVTGLAAVGFGLALAAAGILPRLAINPQTLLAGGDYTRVGGASTLNPPWALDYLVAQVIGMGTGDHHRAAGFGGAVVILTLLAPLLAGRRFAVPFFAVLTLVALTLILDTTPLHRLFYLIPRYQVLHEHDPWRVVALAAIGPAMLSGAAVEALPAWLGQWGRLPLIASPLLLTSLAAAMLPSVERVGGVVGWAPIAAAVTATLVLAAAVATTNGGSSRPAVGRILRGVKIVVLVAVFAQPMGLELTGSWLGWPHDPRWEPHWRPDPAVARALAVEVAKVDPDGVGGFLLARLAAAESFRYAGYSHRGGSYMARWSEPNVQAILVNGRSVFLDLYEIQGYDPIQLSRYAEFVAAINGAPQNYHTAFLQPPKEGVPDRARRPRPGRSDRGQSAPRSSGNTSPRQLIPSSQFHSALLDLLDVRYVLVDASLRQDRDDVIALTAGRREVFRTEHVVVYERASAPPHAWIVHDVRPVTRGEALPLLTGGVVDPYQTALVEGVPPVTAAPDDSAADLARVAAYGPDMMSITTQTAAPGLLVVSEIYESGWRAYVDGEEVEILPTDHALRGIPIPSGEHTVEMRYDPLSLRLGLWISGITAAVMLSAGIVAGWNRFRHVGTTHRADPATPAAAGRDRPVQPNSRASRLARRESGTRRLVPDVCRKSLPRPGVVWLAVRVPCPALLVAHGDEPSAIDVFDENLVVGDSHVDADRGHLQPEASS
jgi:hypothetical protein